MKIVEAAQAQQWDRYTIEQIGIPGIVLMERASLEASKIFVDHFEPTVEDSIGVLCGPGNNGGDGFAVARILIEEGYDVSVYTDCEEYSDDAETNFQILKALGIPLRTFAQLQSHTFFIDALFGTGLTRPIIGNYADAVAFLNRQNLVFAIDVPSGVREVSESELGEVVWADATVTFAAPKISLVLEPGRSAAGELFIADIGIPEQAVDAVGWYADWLVAPRDLIPRPARFHKGDAGRVVVVSGEMPGAAQLAAEAAICSGAGLVRLVGEAQPSMTRRPEVMTERTSDWDESFAWADVIVIGPGLGTNDKALRALRHAWDSDAKLVVDADALNLISENRTTFEPRTHETIFTPHPGEMSRLLDVPTPSLTQLSVGAANDLVTLMGGIAVHKTETTIVSTHGRVAINGTGNPGMATAGMGDVLAGVIAARIADKFEDTFNGVCDAVCAHGAAGDHAATRFGETGVTASSVIESLGEIWKSWEQA